MIKNVCVYCSSSAAAPQTFLDAANALGEAIGRSGFTLVYGGADVGLMGVLSMAVREHRGRIIGVIPQGLADKGLGSQACDEIITTQDLRARKAVMEQYADAFICLPGGFGTLEELLEIITFKQLHLHNKPIVLMNIDQAFQGLIQQFEYCYDKSLVKPEYRDLYFVTDSVAEAMAYITSYVSKVFADKWF